MMNGTAWGRVCALALAGLAVLGRAQWVPVLDERFEDRPAGLEVWRTTPPSWIDVVDGRLRIADDSREVWGGAGWHLGLPAVNRYRVTWRQRVPADGYGGLILLGQGEVIHIGIGQGREAHELMLETPRYGGDFPTATYHPLGDRSEWHTFELDVTGAQVRLSIDGAAAADRAFSGLPVTSVYAWSGVRSAGPVEVDDLVLSVHGAGFDQAEASLARALVDLTALADFTDWGGFAAVEQRVVTVPEPGVMLDFRQAHRWKLGSPMVRLRAGQAYRLSVRLSARAQPMVVRISVVASGMGRPLARLTTRETKGHVRDLEARFQMGDRDAVGTVLFESLVGGGTMTLHHVELTPDDRAVDLYETGAGILAPDLGDVNRRLGLVLEAEACVPPAAMSAEDRDGDGRWAVVTVDADTSPFYWTRGTVLKSDSRAASCLPLALHVKRLRPGPYRLFFSDPGRPVRVRVGDGEALEVPGGTGETDLGAVQVQDNVQVVLEPAATPVPGPVYVDYLRFVPLPDDREPTPVEAGPAALREPAPDMVRLTIAETAGFRRVGEMVVTGVPVAPGVLLLDDGWRTARGIAGEELLAAPLVRWRDGSVKWLRLAFRCSLGAHGEQVLTVPLKAVAEGVPAVGEAPDTVAASGGGSVLPVGLGLAAAPDLVLDMGRGPVPVALRGGRARVEEVSPLRTVRRWDMDVSAEGLPPLQVWLRSDVRAGGRLAGLTVGLVNAAGRSLELRRGDLRFAMPGPAAGPARRLRARGQGRTVAAFEGELEEYTLSVQDRGWVRGGSRGLGHGWLELAGTPRLAVGIRDMLMRYPCALSTQPETGQLTVHLWDGDAPYTWDAGALLAHHFALGVVGDGADTAAAVLAPFLHPLRVHATPAYLCATGVFGRVLPAAHPAVCAGLEDAVARSFDVILEERSAYGLEDFGGVFQPGGYIPGTERMWTNMEYDFVHSALTQYVRTGDRRYARRAEQAAHHWADNDLVWHSPRPWRIGGSFTHSHSMRIGHHVEGPNFGHAGWSQGPLWIYYLTGDRDVLDACTRVAEYVVQNMPEPGTAAAASPAYGLREERSAGHPLITLCTVYEATGDARFLRAARQIADFVYRAQDRDKGNWATPITESPPHRDTTFMISQLYRGLDVYFEATGDPRVPEMLRVHADWLLEHGRSPRGTYAFKHAPKYGRGATTFFWYAHGFALAAEVCASPMRDRLLDAAMGDLRRIHGGRDRSCLFQTDVWNKELQTSNHVAGGEADGFHEYTLAVDGEQVRFAVDGEVPYACRFSGTPATLIRFWSGMRARGTVRIDRVRIRAGTEVILEHDFGDLGGFEPLLRSDACAVRTEDGFLELVDGDETLVSAAWSLPNPATSYSIEWRQNMPAGMYGGLYVVGDAGEILHVGLGQGPRGNTPFTNPRSFAPAVANLMQLMGTDALLRGGSQR